MRKTKVVTITTEGRDKGKQFLITEMSAARAEKWATRALLALANAGIEIPDDMRSAGMAAIAVIGLRALGRVHFSEADPLLDEMMSCVQAMPDPKRPEIIRPLVDDDTEEVLTRVLLKDEVFELHSGFSVAAAIRRSQSEAAQQQPEEESLQSMSTSVRRSA